MNFTEVFGKANWIGTGNDADIPLIFQRFEARRGEAAEITVLGFGVFILYINGVRVHRGSAFRLHPTLRLTIFRRVRSLTTVHM